MRMPDLRPLTKPSRINGLATAWFERAFAWGCRYPYQNDRSSPPMHKGICGFHKANVSRETLALKNHTLAQNVSRETFGKNGGLKNVRT